ncbi:MAG TPA: thiamine pyrophosphate-dependent dehydrogenase E1 component subunit alpha [Herpetosiphonaceae bacterium]
MPGTASEAPGNDDQAAMLHLYQTMLRIRVFEERLLTLRSSGEITGVVHPYIGHEAIAAGVCAALQADDQIASYYRGHGHAIAKGVALPRMMAEIFGRETGLCQGRGGSMHLADWQRGFLGGNAVVGANVPIALGLAMAAQVRQSDQVVVVFFGDGATGAGVVHECLSVASAQHLPIVFVCENNSYQDVTRSDQVFASTDLSRWGGAHLMPGVAVDGNDVLAVRQAARDLVARARSGEGPSFLEAKTYLLRFHAQWGTRPLPEYRPADEVQQWATRDPLPRLRAVLIEQGCAATQLEDLARLVDAEVDEAVAFARESSPPGPETAMRGVFTPTSAQPAASEVP